MSLAPSLIMAPMEDATSERKSPIREFLNSHIKTIVTIFMIFGTIAVIVVIVMVHKWRWESQLEAQAQACLDVAIVGGGISGAYTAWRLRQRGLKVGLYEATDRIGGRFYTQRFDGLPTLHAELGASIFLPQDHPLLNQTIHALNLTPQPARPQSQDQSTFYLRGMRLQHRALNNSVPYRLRQDEKQKYPDELKKLYFKKATVNSSRAYNNLLKVLANDGEPLYMHGYWNLLGNVASREGYNFLYDTAPYRSLLSNANAAVLSKIFLDDLEGKTMTIKEGMDAIPERLMDEFLNASEKHVVKMNHKLECVHDGDHGYRLSFWITRSRQQKTINTFNQAEVCARNVVLALPKFALESLNWGPTNIPVHRMYQYLDTVEDVPSLRVIFVYNKTWWIHKHSHMGHVITDLPIRQVRYLGSQLVSGPLSHSPAGEKHIFLAASPDSTDTDYFSDLSEWFKAGKKCPTTSKIISDISRQMAKVYDIAEEDMPEPESVLVQDWSGSLSGAGWHLWKKGVNYEKVIKRVMQPSRRDSIYIVGSTFCGGLCQLWAEGALKTVEDLLSTHLSPSDIRKR